MAGEPSTESEPSQQNRLYPSRLPALNYSLIVNNNNEDWALGGHVGSGQTRPVLTAIRSESSR